MPMKTLFAIAFVLSTSYLFAQAGKTNKTVSGIQIGLTNLVEQEINYFNESFLFPQAVIRLETGLQKFKSIQYTQKDVYHFFPSISLEPRWYYNIGSRERYGYNSRGNSANYIAVRISHSPLLAMEYNPNLDNKSFNPMSRAATGWVQFHFFRWGMRRNYFNLLNAELSTGAFYIKRLHPQAFKTRPIVLDVSLKLGLNINN
jgi:hypothetical protein